MRPSATTLASPLRLAAPLVALLCSVPVHAQDELDEPPEVTMAKDDDEPTRSPAGQPGTAGGARADGAGPGAESSDPDADSKARALFVQGRAAYDEGEYRDAWDYFHRAYMLSKRPQLLYNVGQAADRLRLDRQALDAFRLYLKKLPEADNRREVENRIAALEQRVEQDGGADAGERGGHPDDGEPRFFDEDGEHGDDAGDAGDAGAGAQPTRTGWSFRGAVGLGLFGDSVSGLPADVSVGSAAVSVHALVGYAIADGLVIGGGLMLDSGLSPSVGVGPATGDLDSASLFSAHAAIDYYLDPKRHGWHLMGGLGVATLSVSDSAALIGNQSVTGGALLLGGGYEWPFGREWAIGVLGRVLLARMQDEPATHVVAAPNIAFTGIWY